MNISYPFLALSLLCGLLGAAFLIFVLQTDTSETSALFELQARPYTLDATALSVSAGGSTASYDSIPLFVRATRLPQGAFSLGVALCYDFTALTPVRDQGSCGACVPFAITSVLADRVALLSGGTYVVPLSTQQLISCTGSDIFWGCTQGADVYQTLAWCQTNGVVAEKFFAYDPTSVVACAYSALNSYRVRVDHENTGRLGWNLEQQVSRERHLQTIHNMQVALYNDGPLFTLIRLYANSQGEYDLLRWPSTAIYKEVSAGAQPREFHALEIVGYYKPQSDPDNFEGAFWLLKNSWGKGWPLDVADTEAAGYFRLAMGTNFCHVEQNALNISPLVEINNVSKSLAYGSASASQQALFDARSASLNYLLYAGISEITLSAVAGALAFVPLQYAVYVILILSLLVALVPTVLYLIETRDLTTSYRLSELQDDEVEKIASSGSGGTLTADNLMTLSSRFLLPAAERIPYLLRYRWIQVRCLSWC
jgi:hypothetical protein